MANETIEEMASLAEDIFAEGIGVSLQRGDLTKVFVAVVVANVVTYTAGVTVKVYLTRKLVKLQEKKEQK